MQVSFISGDFRVSDATANTALAQLHNSFGSLDINVFPQWSGDHLDKVQRDPETP